MLARTLLLFLCSTKEVSGCETFRWSQCPPKSDGSFYQISSLLNVFSTQSAAASITATRLVLLWRERLRHSSALWPSKAKKKTKQSVPLLKVLQKSSCSCAHLIGARCSLSSRLSNTFFILCYDCLKGYNLQKPLCRALDWEISFKMVSYFPDWW